MSGKLPWFFERSFFGHCLSCLGGAVIDNVVRTSFVLAATVACAKGDDPSAIYGLAFILPFLLMASTAGTLSDRVSRKTIFLWARIVEFPLLLIAGTAMWFGSSSLMIVSLALLGVQSAFFAPAKYAVLVDLVPKHKLMHANAIIQAVTTTAILIGIGLAGIVCQQGAQWGVGQGRSAQSGKAEFLTVIGLGIAVLGLIGAVMIRRFQPVDPKRPIAFPLDLRPQWQAMRIRKGLWGPALAISAFWALGALSTLVIPKMLQTELFWTDSFTTVALIAISIGIIAGAAFTPSLAQRSTPAALPLIGVLVCASSMLLCAYFAKLPGAKEIPLAEGLVDPVSLWVHIKTHWNILLACFCTGIGGGLWVVPLNTLLQGRAPEEARSRVLSGVEAMTNLAMLLAFGACFILTKSGVSYLQQVVIFGLIPFIGGLIALFVWRRQLALWFGLRLIRCLWKIRVEGADNVPADGRILIAANHTSYADALILMAACPRHLRFMVHEPYLRAPVIGWFIRASGAIGIDADARNPRAVMESLKKAQAALEEDAAVGIFPEGKLSRSGHLDSFKPGINRLSKPTGAKIIPTHLEGLHECAFGMSPRKNIRLRRPITVRFGQALPPDVAPAEIRRQVLHLAWETANDTLHHETRTLASATIRQVRRNPALPVVADSGGDIRIDRLVAAALAVKGHLHLAKDETRVGLLLPASRGGAIANLAVALSGRTAVNLNHTLGQAGMARCADLSGIRTLITSEKYISRIGAHGLKVREIILEDLMPRIPKWRLIWNLILARCAPIWCLTQGKSTDVTAIVFSSGSTGDPKGVQLTHAQILMNAKQVLRHLEFLPDKDGLLCPLPLFHSFGLSTGLWLPLTSGVRTVVHPDPQDGRALAQLAAKHLPTALISTPTFCRGYMRRVEPKDFASLRFAVAGAEKCPADLRVAWKERYGFDMLEGYGCTELAPVVATNFLDYKDKVVRETLNRPGSVGRPIPGIEILIADPDERSKLLPPGQDGIIIVRSPSRMLGYLGRDDLTAKVFLHEGYDTGDIGHVDDDGFLFLTGRLARFAKIGGEMVPMDLVAERVREVLRVKCGDEIQVELTVASVPDETKGERLLLLATAWPLAPAALVEALSDLPPLWRIRERDCHTVPAIPLTGTGKLDLQAIKTMAMELVK